MILKKPYKFLIKHFRFIHLIIFIATCFITTKTYEIANFFDNYLKSNNLISLNNFKIDYLNIQMILVAITIEFINFIIVYLLFKRKKPIKFYLFNIIVILATIVYYIYIYIILNQMETNVLDIRLIKALNDISVILFFLQVIINCYLFFRTIGFDIKKFNFTKEELTITEEDNEEFEFELGVDSNQFKRKVKRRIRYLKYTYKENKNMIITCSIIAIIILFGFNYINKKFINKVYNMNETFNVNGLNITIIDSYITDKDYSGNPITKNDLLIVKLKTNNILEKSQDLGKMKFNLINDKISYNITENYNEELSDIGKVYNKEMINEKEQIFLIVFEVPKNIDLEDTLLTYYYKNNKKISVKLKIKEFEEKQNTKTYKLGEELNINNEIVGKTKINITDFKISQKFKLYFSYKDYNNKAYLFHEYLTPTYKDNYDRVLIMLNTQYSNQNGVSLESFIEYYAKIEYKVNNKIMYMNAIIYKEKPKKANEKNKYYFSVSKEIMNADEIKLIFNIRNDKYIYYLR